MATLYEDLKGYFLSKALVQQGAIFSDTMMDQPNSAVAIYEYQGNSTLPQIQSATRSIQIVTRDVNAKTSKDKADALYRSLITEDGILDLPGRTCMIQLRQTPFKLKVDAAERTYYCFNIGITTNND